MRILPTLLCVIVLGPADVRAEDYAVLFEEAVERVTWQYPDNWAYTETRRGKETVEVGRYFPSRPDGERWELLSVDGRTPTAEEADEYRESKDGDRGFLGGDEDDREEDDGPSDMVSPGTLKLLEEGDSYWLLGFVPTGDDGDDEKFMKKLSGTARIAKPGRHLEFIDISSEGPVRPAIGVKIRDFTTRFEFAEAVAGGPIVPVAFRFRIAGRAFLAVGFDETETLEFSDFESMSE